MALVGGGLECCWQQGLGGESPGLSKAPKVFLQGLGCPPWGPCRPFCPCLPVCSPGPAVLRGLAQKVPPLVCGQGCRGTHPQLPRGCLCPEGVLGGLGQPLMQAGGAHRPALFARCAQRSTVGSVRVVPVAGETAGSRGGRGDGGKALGGRRVGASVAAWLCEGSVAPRPGEWGGGWAAL